MNEDLTDPLYLLALDPGARTGLASVGVRTKRLIEARTLNFITVEDHICAAYDPREVIIFVERTPKSMFENQKKAQGEQTSERRDFIVMSVGGNIRESELLEARLVHRGFKVKAVAPVGKEKWSEADYRLYTKSKVPVSEHARDAVRLAYKHVDKYHFESRERKTK